LQPGAVTDYTTGYLAAFGVMAALVQRAQHGGSYWVRVSLARTGMWVRSLGHADDFPQTVALADAELGRLRQRIDTAWGPLEHLRPPVTLSGCAVEWRTAPVPLGTHAPGFLE
jgi:hypothetical protein